MRLPILFILITVTLDSMGIGLIMPVMPDLIRDVQGGTLAKAAIWGGILSTSFAAMQFLFGPLIGNLSDRFGRRPVLLVSLAVMALDYLVMAVAESIWLLLAGRIVGGITAATHSTANAYIADISSPKEKAANFGLIGAGFGLGFVLGPVVGGILGEYGPRAPFYAAAAVAGLNFLFGLFVLRETVTDAIRRPFRWANAQPFGAFAQMGRLPGLKALFAVYLLYSIAFYVYPSVWSYFGQERFGWSTQTIGLTLALYGIAAAIVQGLLVRPALRFMGLNHTIVFGLIFDVIAFFLISVMTNGLWVMFMTPISAIGALATPALQGTMSDIAGKDEQGALQGALTSLGALSMILSPMLMTSVFAAFTRSGAPIYAPGAPFAVAMVLTILALLLYLRHGRASA